MTKPPKRPRDPNQLARAIVDIVAGETPEQPQTPKVAGARKGGLKGGEESGDTMHVP